MNAGSVIVRHRQAGFGALVAILVLVILAALAAAMTRFGSVQHMTSAQDVMAVRALVAARTGVEWGLYQAFNATPPCAASNDLSVDGFSVNVNCVLSDEFREGESAPGTPNRIHLYTLTATACNMPDAAGHCPNAGAVPLPGYVERVLQVVVNQ